MMATIEKCESTYSSWFPSFAELPMEIILHIFQFLDHSDVQAAGRTCLQWREASFNTDHIKKISVRFTKLFLSDSLPPALDFIQCNQPYYNYYFEDITFGPVQQFIRHIGKTACEITFDNVDMGDKQFCAIMRHLPKIRSLTISSCSPIFMSGSFLDNSEDRMTIGINFANIRHLSLRDNQYLSDAILLRMTELINNIYSLDLSGCHIAYHNAIQRRFYPSDVDILPSESILTFKFITRILEMHHRSLCNVNFSNTLIGGPSLIALCELGCGELRLKHLGLANCRQLNTISLETFLKVQVNLLVLDLSDTICVNDSCIDVIVTHLPILEELNIAGCVNISNRGATVLSMLKRLKCLNISHCDGIRSEGLTDGLAATKNSTLMELQMAYLQVCEEAIKVLAKNLPELRVLNLGHCVNGVTDESVQCIIQSLRWLRDLSFENCFRITDAALTGIDISRLIVPNSSSSLDSLQPLYVSSLAERDYINESNLSIKISLRSKAEEEIVRDANRKKAMFAAYELNLIGNCDIEGYNIKELRGLKVLKLSGCHKITDVSLKYGFKFPELCNLSLSNCQQISFVGIEQLVQDCPSIERLDLCDCESINDKAIQVITTKLARLRALHINGCGQITDHALDSILINCNNLQTLSVHRCRRIYTDIEDKLAKISTLRNLNTDNKTNMDNACLLGFKKRLDY